MLRARMARKDATQPKSMSISLVSQLVQVVLARATTVNFAMWASQSSPSPQESIPTLDMLWRQE